MLELSVAPIQMKSDPSLENTKPVVFVIDDDVDHGRFVSSAVQALGLAVEVDCFCHPDDAWKSLSERNPALILLDYNMPDCNGDAWMVRMSESLQFGDRRIVLVTSQGIDDDFEFQLLSLGIEEIVPKPMRMEKLKVLIEEIL